MTDPEIDFERRLRAAMSAAASRPPAGLMQGIRRRHRRHLVRAGAGFAALVAALALAAPPLTHAARSALRGPGPASTGPATGPSCPPRIPDFFGCSRYVGPSAVPSTVPGVASTQQVCPVFCGPPSTASRAAPGTELQNCDSANGAAEIAGFRPRSIRAGPVWFVGARDRGEWAASQRLPNGQIRGAGAMIAVVASVTVVVRVAPAARSRFRFLRDFNNTDRYRMGGRGQLAGLTLAACPRSYEGPVSVFWVSYLSDGLSCVPFEVSVPGRPPFRVALSVTGGTWAAYRREIHRLRAGWREPSGPSEEIFREPPA
jgi:hypothetical protein